MSKAITARIGDDKKLIFTIRTIDAATKVKSLQDLTGSYLYFRAFRSDGTELALKDNDPAGANVGVSYLDAVNGQAQVLLTDSDFAAAVAGTGLSYSAKLRLDPAGSDDRYTVASGDFTLLAEEISVP